jgi:transposase
MEVIRARCAGLDVHKDSVVVCVRVQEGGQVRRTVRTFGTVTQELLALGDWLEAEKCTHAAMEATGVYWKPVWHMLEGRVELILANAAHIRNVPGRKSDVNDATWIGDLVAHGLIRSSFVPPEPIGELRDLTRTRKQLTREIVQHTQRIQRVLQEANVKLDSVISDILGVSGRRILRAMIDGEQDPQVLASLGSPRLESSPRELKEALRGRVTAHHRFLLSQHLGLIENLERTIEQFDQEIARAIQPFREVVQRLTGIPGVATVGAQAMLSEIGLDMGQFPEVGHLISWATLCPRLDESAGRARSTRVRKGGTWLKPLLVQCAWAAVRSKDTYLRSQYLRLKARRGPKKAIVAVAASILTAAYHIVKYGVEYCDLGGAYFQKRDSERVALRLATRIRELGYEVNISRVA